MSLLLMVLILYSFSLAEEQAGKDTLGYIILSIKKGDRCIVCDVPLQESELAILYRGRRVPLDTDHVADFLRNPSRYFAKLEPQGALFQEKAILEKPINFRWFVIGLWIALALVAAGFCSNIALNKGLSPIHWFFRGLSTSFIGVLWVLVYPPRARVNLPPRLAKLPRTLPPVYCQDCGAYTHPSATTCSGCGKERTPDLESEVKRAGIS